MSEQQTVGNPPPPVTPPAAAASSDLCIGPPTEPTRPLVLRRRRRRRRRPGLQMPSVALWRPASGAPPPPPGSPLPPARDQPAQRRIRRVRPPAPAARAPSSRGSVCPCLSPSRPHWAQASGAHPPQPCCPASAGGAGTRCSLLLFAVPCLPLLCRQWHLATPPRATSGTSRRRLASRTALWTGELLRNDTYIPMTNFAT